VSTIREIKFLSYNVAGLKPKVLDALFLNFVKSFDVFLFYETFIVEDDFNKFSIYFNDYKLHWISGRKTSKFGRASGGRLYAIRKSLPEKIIGYSSMNGETVIYLIRNSLRVAIVPVYLNCNSWKEDFQSLKNFLQDSFFTNFVIVGDLNVRIGEAQELPDSMYLDNPKCVHNRISKDKSINSNGSAFLELCDDHGLVILNGRFEGDSNGEFTFIGSVGCSVNDICSVSVNCLSLVSSFEVVEESFSDHLPLSFGISDISSNCYIPAFSCPNSLSPLPWIPQYLDTYRKKLNLAVSRLPTPSDPQVEAIDLRSCIVESVPISTRASPKQKFIRKNLWFNYKCWSARSRAFKLLKLFRISNSNLIRLAYRDAVIVYKNVCKEAKIKHSSDLKLRLTEVKDSKEFWKIVNQHRRKDFVWGNIQEETVMAHFKSLLNTSFDSITQFAAPSIFSDVLDPLFTIGELTGVVSGLKNSKAPGLDRIPNEFYKFASPAFLDRLLALFNSIYSTGNVPLSFSQSIIIPLYKNGDKCDITNYRGISCLQLFF